MQYLVKEKKIVHFTTLPIIHFRYCAPVQIFCCIIPFHFVVNTDYPLSFAEFKTCCVMIVSVTTADIFHHKTKNMISRTKNSHE